MYILSFVEPVDIGEMSANNNGASEGKTKVKNKSSNKNLTSDAILACPACLTTLCIDCQR